MPSIGVFGQRVPGHAELFKKWDSLVHLMVRKNLWRLGSWFDYDDLLNHARQGLWRAHETYDPNREANFQTWARCIINNAFNALYHYSRADMRRDRVKSDSVDDESVELHLPSGSVPADDKMISDEEAVLVRSSMSSLTVRERKVIMDRLVRDKTLDDVGEDLGVTRERARQIERAALLKMSSSLEGLFSRKSSSRPSLRNRKSPPRG